jgi:DNA-nicking Smr family endonuclease
MEREPARRFLADGIVNAFAAGARVLIVVHGRGLHSGAHGPVLKALVPEWLVEPPLSSYVLALTPARPGDGGDGALYLYLRRAR